MNQARQSYLERRRELLAKRNKAIAKRFNELFEVKRLRLDDVLDRLSEEFYLESKYIWTLLKSNKGSDPKDGFNEEGVHKDQGELFE